jgi:hypothetical protein
VALVGTGPDVRHQSRGPAAGDEAPTTEAPATEEPVFEVEETLTGDGGATQS